MHTDRSEKCYDSPTNEPLLSFAESGWRRVLDVGCGAGGNARMLARHLPGASLYGITISRAERELAAPVMRECWLGDLETSDLAFLAGHSFDAIIFSHILEHLREPDRVLARFLTHLEPGGSVVVAVPNVLFWRQRWAYLRGRFEYAEHGILDDTHLRFFTYDTADSYLLRRAAGLAVVEKRAQGALPLWRLRRLLLPESFNRASDSRGVRRFPNLLGEQVLFKARRVGD